MKVRNKDKLFIAAKQFCQKKKSQSKRKRERDTESNIKKNKTILTKYHKKMSYFILHELGLVNGVENILSVIKFPYRKHNCLYEDYIPKQWLGF